LIERLMGDIVDFLTNELNGGLDVSEEVSTGWAVQK
jgi:hypothetical protein